jgi:hypothetical protein
MEVEMRNRSEKRYGAAFLAAGLVLAMALSGSARDRETYEEKFEKVENLARDGRVFLSNLSGTIDVKVWKDEKVRIEAVKVSRAATQEAARENAGQVTIEVTREAGELRIETKYPRRKGGWGDRSLNVSVNYTLWIPDKASPEIKSISGDIKVEAAGGAVKAGAISGGVDILGASGNVDINVVSGGIRLENISGDVYLKAVSGNIEVARVKGSIQAETVSGRVRLEDVSEARTVRAKSLSGGIVYNGTIDAKGRYTLESHSGNVRMTIPAASAFDFNANTFSGVIETDFPIEVSGKISPRELRGVVGGGGADIKLSSFSGNIELRKN